MKRKPTPARSATKRSRGQVRTVSSPGAIENAAHNSWLKNHDVKWEMTKMLAEEIGRQNANNFVGMMNTYAPNVVSKARAMVESAKMIRKTYKTHFDVLKDEGRAHLIALKIQRLIESYTNLTVSCKTKKECVGSIEKMTGLVAGTPSSGVASFTLKIGNAGYDPRINLQKKIAFNRQTLSLGSRQGASKPLIIGGYRIRVQLEFHVKRLSPSMYTVSRVDIVSVLVAKDNVPAEVYFQSTRAHGAEAWFDDRIKKNTNDNGRTTYRTAYLAQIQRVAHVFATGIIVDALLAKRPSKPKFHHVNFSRFNNNRGSNANNSWSNSNNNGNNNSRINMASFAPILARLVHALKAKGYVERDSVYITNNEGITNTNEGRQRNMNLFHAQLENMNNGSNIN